MGERQHGYRRAALTGRRASVDVEVADQIIETLMAATSAQDLLETVVEHGYDGLRPAQAAVATMQADGCLHLVAGIEVPTSIRASFPMSPAETRPLAQAIVDRGAIWIESAADRDRWYPSLTRYAGLPSAGGFLPLDLARGIVGVLAVLFDHDRTISEPERSYYRLLANLYALTFDRLTLRAGR